MTKLPSIEMTISASEELIETMINSWVDKIESEKMALSVQGVGVKKILELFIKDSETLTGLLSGAKTSIGLKASQIVNINHQSAYNNAILKKFADDSDVYQRLFKRVLEPGAKHCASCWAKRNQIKTYGEWIDEGLPGSGVDDCMHNCQCTLVPIRQEEK